MGPSYVVVIMRTLMVDEFMVIKGEFRIQELDKASSKLDIINHWANNIPRVTTAIRLIIQDCKSRSPPSSDFAEIGKICTTDMRILMAEEFVRD